MNLGLELRLPFLDQSLVQYALKIPAEYKLKEGIGKYILREIAQENGLSEEFAFRKKTAAQYGSRIDHALGKLAGKKTKSEYLKQFYPANARLGVLFSGGKDSTTAAFIMQQQNYELACLIHIRSANTDSYMFQEAGTEIIELQAKALGLPLIIQETAGEKEKELRDLENALVKAKREYRIEGIVSGALFSTYQRDRIDAICDTLGLKIFSPLWHKDQEQHLHEIVQNGFEVVVVKVAAEGLDKKWLGRTIDLQFIEDVKKLNKKVGLNIAFEGGEAETLVLSGPLFKKRIVVKETQIIQEGSSAKLIIKKAELVD